MAEAKCKHSCVANTWVRQMDFEKSGDTMEGHRHTFDHQTLFAYGEFEITVEGKGIYEAKAPVIFTTKAGDLHSIKAKTDAAVAYCIHALRKGEEMEDIAAPDEICEGWHEGDTTPLHSEGRGELFFKPAPLKAEKISDA
jgi:hypothetical protein